jgi:chromosome segregation ATPase
MVNFTKNQIIYAKDYTYELKNQIWNNKNDIENNLSSIETKLDQKLAEVQNCLERCSRDISTLKDAIAYNHGKRSEFNREFNSARSELESLRGSETPDTAAIARCEKVKTLAEGLQRTAERMIKQLESQVGSLTWQHLKLEGAYSRVKKVRSNFLSDKITVIRLLNDAERMMKSAHSYCNSALDTISGIFTSCQIENSDVLVVYKSRLNNACANLGNPSVHLTQGVSNVSNSVKGLSFLNVMTSQTMQAAQEFLLMKKNLEEKIKELDKYIACLKKYEKI